MEIIYLGGDQDHEDELEAIARLDRNEVEAHCAKCKTKLLVFRLEGKPDGLVHALRCPTNQNHFMLSLTRSKPDWGNMK